MNSVASATEPRKPRPKPAMQGGPDGQCGIYALLNFLRSGTIAARDRKIPHQPMISAGKQNLLTAFRLYNGFDESASAQIFSKTVEQLRFPFEARLLKKYGQGTFSEQLASALSERGQIVASIDAEKHWVLARGLTQPCFKVDDPDQTAVPRRRLFPKTGAQRAKRSGTSFAAFEQNWRR